MKILQLVRAMDMGGLEVVVSNLSSMLIKQGVDVDLACLSHAGAMASEDAFNQIWVGNLSGRIKPIDPVCLFRLCRYIRRRDIDVIHSHNPQALLYAFSASLISGVPFVHTVHGRGGNDPKEECRKAGIRRLALRRAIGFVAVSSDVKQKLLDVDKLPAQKIRTILNGVDTAKFRRLAAEGTERERRLRLGVPEGAVVVGSVGRFSKEKNYPLLVQAFKLVAEKCGNVHLLLVGDGAEADRIREEIEKQSIGDKVSLVGAQKDVMPWLQIMDIFCLSSDSEGTPVALLEAGAMGLPSVVTDVGGNGEIVIDGVTGYVVPGGDKDAFFTALLKLIKDNDLRKRFRQAALEQVVSNYSADSMIAEYISLYELAKNKKGL